MNILLNKFLIFLYLIIAISIIYLIIAYIFKLFPFYKKECIYDYDCKDNLVCSNNKCVKMCNNDNDCLYENKCVNYKCTTCSDYRDCPIGKICNTGNCTNCVNNKDCEIQNKVCIDGNCKECTSYLQCDINQDCKDGKCFTPIYKDGYQWNLEIGAYSNIRDGVECSKKCEENKNCKHWNYNKNTKTCGLVAGSNVCVNNIKDIITDDNSKICDKTKCTMSKFPFPSKDEQFDCTEDKNCQNKEDTSGLYGCIDGKCYGINYLDITCGDTSGVIDSNMMSDEGPVDTLMNSCNGKNQGDTCTSNFKSGSIENGKCSKFMGDKLICMSENVCTPIINETNIRNTQGQCINFKDVTTPL